MLSPFEWSHSQLSAKIRNIYSNFFVQMIGISFHVGSGCEDAPAYGRGIKAARKLFDIAKTIGYDFKLLDIGGENFFRKKENEKAFDLICILINWLIICAVFRRLPRRNRFWPDRGMCKISFIILNSLTKMTIKENTNKQSTKAPQRYEKPLFFARSLYQVHR